MNKTNLLLAASFVALTACAHRPPPRGPSGHPHDPGRGDVHCPMQSDGKRDHSHGSDKPNCPMKDDRSDKDDDHHQKH